MGIWIELHCDNQAPTVDGCGRVACVSGSGNQPGVMVVRRPARAVAALVKQAKKEGWMVSADGLMTCPKCADYWAKSGNGGRS